MKTKATASKKAKARTPPPVVTRVEKSIADDATSSSVETEEVTDDERSFSSLTRDTGALGLDALPAEVQLFKEDQAWLEMLHEKKNQQTNATEQDDPVNEARTGLLEAVLEIRYKLRQLQGQKRLAELTFRSKNRNGSASFSSNNSNNNGNANDESDNEEEKAYDIERLRVEIENLEAAEQRLFAENAPLNEKEEGELLQLLALQELRDKILKAEKRSRQFVLDFLDSVAKEEEAKKNIQKTESSLDQVQQLQKHIKKKTNHVSSNNNVSKPPLSPPRPGRSSEPEPERLLHDLMVKRTNSFCSAAASPGGEHYGPDSQQHDAEHRKQEEEEKRAAEEEEEWKNSLVERLHEIRYKIKRLDAAETAALYKCTQTEKTTVKEQKKLFKTVDQLRLEMHKLEATERNVASQQGSAGGDNSDFSAKIREVQQQVMLMQAIRDLRFKHPELMKKRREDGDNDNGHVDDDEEKEEKDGTAHQPGARRASADDELLDSLMHQLHDKIDNLQMQEHWRNMTTTTPKGKAIDPASWDVMWGWFSPSSPSWWQGWEQLVVRMNKQWDAATSIPCGTTTMSAAAD